MPIKIESHGQKYLILLEEEKMKFIEIAKNMPRDEFFKDTVYIENKPYPVRVTFSIGSTYVDMVPFIGY